VAGAYVITSWLSATLAHTYSWRIMWLIGMPTGILLVLLTRFVPESPRFLLAYGRHAEAERVLRSYNASIVTVPESESTWSGVVPTSFTGLVRSPLGGITAVLVLVGLGIGLVVYGFQLWLPSNLRALGFSGVSADRILRDSALLGFPLNFVVALCYHRSTRWTMAVLCAALTAALVPYVVLGSHIVDHRVLLRAVLIVPIWGSSSVVAVLMAYSGEAYPTALRTRAGGLAAGMSKVGGVAVIAFVTLRLAAPSIRATALLGAVPLAMATMVALAILIETRRRPLEEITDDEFHTAIA
jgi:putative MFS transporter